MLAWIKPLLTIVATGYLLLLAVCGLTSASGSKRASDCSVTQPSGPAWRPELIGRGPAVSAPATQRSPPTVVMTADPPPSPRLTQLVEEVHELPRPPQGKEWIAADLPRTVAYRHRPVAPTFTWDRGHVEGPAASIVDAIGRGQLGVPWGRLRGESLRRLDEYRFSAHTSRIVHEYIELQLSILQWTALPTTQTIANELVWMLQRGTDVEVDWARDALDVLPGVVRNLVDDARDVQALAEEAPTEVSTDDLDSSAPHLRLRWSLVRAEKSLLQGIGFIPGLGGLGDGRLGTGDSGVCVHCLDDTVWEVLQRAIQRGDRIRELGKGQTALRARSPDQLTMDEQAIMHVRAAVSENQRFIHLECRIHARVAGALQFAPQFKVSVPDCGVLWICVRDVLSGTPSPDHELGILLRMEIVSERGWRENQLQELPRDSDYLPVAEDAPTARPDPRR